jgi:hypothetical protein
MKIDKQLKPALITYWMKKAFNAFYPNVAYHPSASAPNSYKDLLQYESVVKYNRGSLPVFDGNCENTIYQNPSDNHTFRAWHDCIHITEKLSFKPIDEKKVGQIQCQQLKAIGAPVHVINAVYFDVIGQIEYYSCHGDFVKDQKQFVQDCLNLGLKQAIKLAYDTATIQA